MGVGGSFFANAYSGYGFSTMTPNSMHPDKPVPDVDCSCGFYAHYDPTTDFYVGTQWEVKKREGGGGRVVYFDPYDTSPYYSYSPSGYEGSAMVRAVCEASGKVVMGTKGVRAAKVRIVAVSVDWEKYCKQGEHYNGGFSYDFWNATHPTIDYAYERWRLERRRPPRDVRNAVDERLDQVAKQYGAKVYEDPAEMYADHPMPDLTALGIEPAP
jgi:hypothetical protein